MDGVDAQTLDAYDRLSAAYAEEWESQPPPQDMYSLIDEFFVPGPVADIGCGSGRDTAWLSEHGFQATGFDPSPGLLEEARRRHPTIEFHQAALPELAGLEPESFANVLCETVLMHLANDQIGPSVARMLEILSRGGTLYLSWRVNDERDYRDPNGRLYSAFDPSLVSEALAGAEVLHDATVLSESSGATIRRVLARRRDGI